MESTRNRGSPQASEKFDQSAPFSLSSPVSRIIFQWLIVRLIGSRRQTINFASGHHSEILVTASGQERVCTEQSNFTPSPTKHEEYRSQFGNRTSLPKVPLCVATSLGSFGFETQIPGCCSNTLANQVVPDLGTPIKNAPTSGTTSPSRPTTPLRTFSI